MPKADQRATADRRARADRPASTDLRRTLGRDGEDLAVAHMERLGYAIVARNYRTRYGEIDVIACDGRTLVIAEVKTRRGAAAGRSPLESLHEHKQVQVRRMAREWLAQSVERPRTRDLRFDAIGVTLDASGRLVALEHVEGAF